MGYRVGGSRGVEVWASVEDSILLIGPPRSGKGVHIVINSILCAPGAVVTTSTRPDNVTATIRAREQVGPVAVFDPQHLADGIPAGLRWSPVRGCNDPLTSMIRAAGLASATGLGKGGVEGGDFWEAKTRVALQCLLHAAALDGRQPADLFRWTLDPAAAGDAVSILATHPLAAGGWAEALQAMIEADPRTRDSIWQGVSLALAALADPRVLNAVRPGPEEVFDPEAFLEQKGTLYLLATAAGANNSAPLVAALIEDVVEAARRLAARSAGARLDPPLLLCAGRSREPLPAAVVADAHGRRRRHGHHDHARYAIPRTSTRTVVGERGVRDLGCRDREDHPRRRLQQQGSPRPVHAHRGTRRNHRLHHRRRPRLPLRATLHPPSPDHAPGRDPPPPVRHWPRTTARSTTDRDQAAPLDPTPRRETARRGPARGRSTTPLPGGRAGCGWFVMHGRST